MSEEYQTFTLFQALSIAQNTKANAVDSIANSTTIHMDYCIPKQFSKRRTDVSGAETEEEIGPDTGPAGQFVELKITIERKAAADQSVLDTLLTWHGTNNTNSIFRRGFLGLENDDNPSLNQNPIATIGYKLANFQLINPVGNKGTQEYIITLQLVGDSKNLDVFGP